MLSHIFFNEIFKEIKNQFPKFLDDLSKNLDKNQKENEIRSIDITINSIKTEPKGFSVKLFGFHPEKYNKDYLEEKTFKDDEVVLSFCIEGQNKSSFENIGDIIEKLKDYFNKKKSSNNIPYINISERIESDMLYLDFILKISEIKWVKEFLKFKIDFYEYENIDFKLNSKFTFDKLFDKPREEFIMEICSFFFSIKGEIKNLEYLLISLLNTLEKYLKASKFKKIKKIIYLILGFENMKFNFNFLPEKLKNFFPDDQKEYEKYINIAKTFLQAVLVPTNDNIYARIIKSVKFEHVLISFLVSKYNSGFILDINLPGLTKTLIELNH